MRSDKPVVVNALAAINQLITGLLDAGWSGIKPLDDLEVGIPQDEGKCPIALSMPYGDEALEVRPCETGGVVYFSDYHLAQYAARIWSVPAPQFQADGYEVCLPDALNEFGLDFDCNRIPEYVDPAYAATMAAMEEYERTKVR